ncbi:hypothetical protein [Actinomadura decatromicini]|uniref:Uncharacterized protein n=1 Tax=Actinomadura decatromicini TaxID=2604572 RepID=A0A5D3F8T3_9ACTN|nr:hypothetical protein [Actinomadura decatromicini]TYK43775.1 hypothetical protein FXF68_37190 [Actinomadura decatromicini]
MSSYYQIFIRAPGAGEREVAAVAAAAGCPLEPTGEGDDGVAFAGRVGSTKVQVELSHDFDDDYGIAFSSYPMVVTVIDLERDKAREEACVRSIFHRLAEGGEYSMVLVFDLSVPIDRFDTASS